MPPKCLVKFRTRLSKCAKAPERMLSHRRRQCSGWKVGPVCWAEPLASFAQSGSDLTRASQNYMERAFSPRFLLLHANLGLRPRLVSGRAFSAQYANLNKVLRAEGPPYNSLGRSPRNCAHRQRRAESPHHRQY